MAEFRALLRPGGILLLAVPLWTEDAMLSLLLRLYGPVRLPLLLQGWDFRGAINRGAWLGDAVPLGNLFDYGWQPILILRRPTDDELTSSSSSSSSLCSLDCESMAGQCVPRRRNGAACAINAPSNWKQLQSIWLRTVSRTNSTDAAAGDDEQER
jgi:hypothetical protein